MSLSFPQIQGPFSGCGVADLGSGFTFQLPWLPLHCLLCFLPPHISEVLVVCNSSSLHTPTHADDCLDADSRKASLPQSSPASKPYSIAGISPVSPKHLRSNRSRIELIISTPKLPWYRTSPPKSTFKPESQESLPSDLFHAGVSLFLPGSTDNT